MSFANTNSLGSEPLINWRNSTSGGWRTLQVFGGVLALAGSHHGVGATPVPTGPKLEMVASIGGGTSRAARPMNYYRPKTDFGRKLLALRQAAISEGAELLTEAQIAEKLELFRG